MFTSAFSSHFQLQKPPGWHHKARMVGPSNLLVERCEFMLTKPLNYHIPKNGGTIIKLFLCRSVDGISHLMWHFGQVLTSKISSEHRNLSVGELSYPDFLSCPNKAITDARNFPFLKMALDRPTTTERFLCKSAETICITHNLKHFSMQKTRTK